MDAEAMKSVAIVVSPLLAGLGGVFVGRRQRVLVATGTSLDNEGKAIDLYNDMVGIAQGQQERLLAALGEVDGFRVALAECVAARELAARNDALREQERRIAQAAADVAIAKQNHRIAELELQVMAIQAMPTLPTEQDG